LEPARVIDLINWSQDLKRKGITPCLSYD
jgi:hypothetical protein